MLPRQDAALDIPAAALDSPPPNYDYPITEGAFMAKIKYRQGSEMKTLLDTSIPGYRILIDNISLFPNESWSLDISNYKDTVTSGILLVWSAYDNNTSTVLNESWQTSFVPRRMLADGTGYEMQFPVITGYAAKTVTGKLLFIQNWKITGSDLNGDSSTTVNGAAATTRWVVLRSVIAM